MYVEHLWQAFEEGVHEDARLRTITLQQRRMGDLVLPTGKVVACDPLAFPETPPFHKALPSGCYPVIASEVIFAENSDRRIAYARLQCSEREPVRWELATLAGQDIASLKEDEFFGFPVDAGAACFMDIDAAAGLQRRLKAVQEYNGSYAESLINNLCQGSVNVTFNPFTGANAIMFSSGWGDSYYASYWGYDARGDIACLLTDFALFNHPTPGSRPFQRKRRLMDKLLRIWREHR